MTKSGNFETTYLPHLCKRSLWMSLTGIANETPLFRHFIVILPLWSEKSRLAYQKLRCSVVTVYCINFKSTGRFRQSCLAFFQNLNFISLLHCFWDFSLCRLTKRMKIRSITRIFRKFLNLYNWLNMYTSHSAYDTTSAECNGVKNDGFLYPNPMLIPKTVSKKFLHCPPLSTQKATWV